MQFLRFLSFFLSFFSLSIQAQEHHFIEIIPENNVVKDIAKSRFIENFTDSPEVISIQYIEITDVFDRQFEGKLNFSISNRMFGNCTLNAVDVSYEDSNNYKWRGNTHDKSFDITIIKNSNGYSGCIIDSKADKSYHILPVNTTASILIEVEVKGIHCDISPKPNPDHMEGDCDEVCPGHIDILFLVTPEAQDWLEDESLNDTYFGFDDLGDRNGFSK